MGDPLPFTAPHTYDEVGELALESETPGPPTAKPQPGRSWTATYASVLRRPTGVVGVTVLGLWVVVAFLWPILVPYGPTDVHLLERFVQPSTHHWFGTDNLGRDVFSRTLAGSRTVLLIATAATAHEGL